MYTNPATEVSVSIWGGGIFHFDILPGDFGRDLVGINLHQIQFVVCSDRTAALAAGATTGAGGGGSRRFLHRGANYALQICLALETCNAGLGIANAL